VNSSNDIRAELAKYYVAFAIYESAATKACSEGVKVKDRNLSGMSKGEWRGYEGVIGSGLAGFAWSSPALSDPSQVWALPRRPRPTAPSGGRVAPTRRSGAP
jgi:hypothetical protein